MTRKLPPGLTPHQQAQWYRDEADRLLRWAQRWAVMSMVAVVLACVLIVTATIMSAHG